MEKDHDSERSKEPSAGKSTGKFRRFWDFYLKPKGKVEWIFFILVIIGGVGVLIFLILVYLKNA